MDRRSLARYSRGVSKSQIQVSDLTLSHFSLLQNEDKPYGNIAKMNEMYI